MGAGLMFVAIAAVCLTAATSKGRIDIEGVERLPGEAGWRITWKSEPGARYQLQRNFGLTPLGWQDVQAVVATQTTTSLDDGGVAGRDRVFWRVTKTGPADNEAPAAGMPAARLVEKDGDTFIELSVSATDNTGVSRVIFFDAETELGEGTEGADGIWRLLVAYDAGSENLMEIRATAQDAAGNAGPSGFFGLRPSQPYGEGVFALVDGEPDGRALLSENPDGTLAPFTYIPDNHAGGSFSRALRFDFVDGARIVDAGGVSSFSTFGNFGGGTAGKTIEFTRAQLKFGPDSPLSFDPGKVPLLPDGVPGYLLDFPINAPELLDMGPIDVPELRDLIGLAPDEGLPLQLFEEFAFEWADGVLTELGIIAGQFKLPDLGIPLPEFSEQYLEAAFDFFNGKDAEIPIAGEWELPDGGPKIRATKAKPVVLTIKKDGSLALRGPVEVEFDNGVKLTATILLDDPIMRLVLETKTINIPMLTLLGLILPDDPLGCMGDGISNAQITAMQECVLAHDKAYRAFLQGALQARPESAADESLGYFPGVQSFCGGGT